MVTRFHSAEDAVAAWSRRKNVAAGGLPDSVDEIEVVAEGDGIWLGKALALAGLSQSTGEGGRLVKGGAVHLDGVVVKDDRLKLKKGRRYLVRVGLKNRRFAYLKVR